MKREMLWSFVSWKQIMEGGGEGRASLTVSHFSKSLRPLTFHEMVERVVLECLAIREHNVRVAGKQTKPGTTITGKCDQH